MSFKTNSVFTVFYQCFHGISVHTSTTMKSYIPIFAHK